MILVDSSVWIDYFRGKSTRQTDRLDTLLDREPIAIGDLILVEVLHGFVPDRDFQKAKALFAPLALIELGGADVSHRAAANYRKLRSAGATVRPQDDRYDHRDPMHRGSIHAAPQRQGLRTVRQASGAAIGVLKRAWTPPSEVERAA